MWEATSGGEATGQLPLHLGEIGLALIDLVLHDREGVGLLKELRGLKPSLRCWLMSGDVEDEQGLLSAGADAVLHKPFSVLEVAERLRCLASSPR